MKNKREVREPEYNLDLEGINRNVGGWDTYYSYVGLDGYSISGSVYKVKITIGIPFFNLRLSKSLTIAQARKLANDINVWADYLENANAALGRHEDPLVKVNKHDVK